MTMRLLTESVRLPPDTSNDGKTVGYPLYITAKRYYVKELEEFSGDGDALTLLALHSTSFHKETWEPTLERLFELAAKSGKENVKICEVWAVDCPNHGYAGVLNRDVLKTKEFVSHFGCDGYAAALHRFLVHAPRAFGVDFENRRLVGLGHSLGANSILLLQQLTPAFPFVSLIIVEPLISPDGEHHLYKLRDNLVEATKRRVIEWPDRETALQSLKRNPRTAKWDERVLKVFVEHAISPLPSGGVGLNCTREQEMIMYLEPEGSTKPVNVLSRLCSRLPVHVILGSDNDLIPRNVHEAILDSSSGRKYASVTEIQDVGHLIPQQIPDELGRIVYDQLMLTMGRPAKL